MADVTEVIHNITYNVNNEALDNATKAIQLQIAELDRLFNSLQKYKLQMAVAGRNESSELERLSKKIDDINTKISATSKKLEGTLRQVGNGILKGLDIDGKIETAVEGITAKLVSGFSKLEKLDFKSIAGLATNLLSFSNIAPLAISFLVDLTSNLFSTSDAAKKAEKSYGDFLKRLNENKENAARATDQQIGEASLLINTVRDISHPEKNRRGAAEKLKTDYSNFYADFSTHQILNGEAEKANQNLLAQINHYRTSIRYQNDVLELQAALRSGQENEASVLKKIASLRADVEAQISSDNRGKFEDYSVNRINKLNESIKRHEAEYNKLREINGRYSDQISKAKHNAQKFANLSPDLSFPITDSQSTDFTHHSGGYISSQSKVEKRTPPKLDLPLPTEEEGEESARQVADGIINSLKKTLKQQLGEIELGELQAIIQLEEQYKNDEITFEIYEERKKKIHDEALVSRYTTEEESYGEIAGLRDADVQDTQEAEQKKLEAQQKSLEKQNEIKKQTATQNTATGISKKASVKNLLDPFKNLDEEEREAISKQIAAYQELVQAAAEAYNKILQVKIDALDKEISIREKRVEEAKKLAERGNTEALRLEEERLRKAQQQRENFARRQQAVNAAITVSNAIAAVARAALDGGGFGSVATIAALVAALAAGYAAVTSLSNDSGNSFADGVIDYKGKGGPRDDKNWVRISAGESIITAEGTKKHRALLEAINNGAGLQLPGTALPLVMPAFKAPEMGIQGQYASATDMQRLETKLDEVVDAIESNQLKQDIFFNEQGVGIMTERAIQRDRRRWK